MDNLRNIGLITKRLLSLILILAVILGTVSCTVDSKPHYADSLNDIPEFSGRTHVIVNKNIPFFTEDEITTEAYEFYSPLDALGRCGVAMACLGIEIMPTEERSGSLSSVTPSGFVNVAYDGEYLYHRAHLIGWQLAGEGANKLNLITGTRFMNVEGMLPFENMVDDYIEETNNHVMYRVTPIYKDNELVARGVLMEAYTVEDNGGKEGEDGFTFCVYIYNNQPGVRINYLTGQSKPDDGVPFPDGEEKPLPDEGEDYEYMYVLNISSKKIHLPSCQYAKSMNESNREYSNEELRDLILSGYSKCGSCMK